MFVALIFLGLLQPNIEIGQVLSPPAQVAGPWEGLVAPGKVAGFSLEVGTNADETVRSLNLCTYVRADGKSKRTCWSSGDAGEFVLRTRHLHFHQPHGGERGSDVTLDLSFDPSDQTWKGSFDDPFFEGQVTLRRPALTDSAWPAGTWRTYTSVTIWPTERVQDFGCLNVGVGQDNALVLWAEWHNSFLPESTEKQPSFGDFYGEFYDDALAEHAHEVSFTAGTSLSGDRFTGVLSSDGSSFGGWSEHYGNGYSDPVDPADPRAHPRRAFVWTRMLDLACRP